MAYQELKQELNSKHMHSNKQSLIQVNKISQQFFKQEVWV